MTPVQEQQMLTSLTTISQDIKAVVALLKELTLQQGTADEGLLAAGEHRA